MEEDSNDIHMLTTADNPFNPFTQFDEWLAYDTKEGWHTLSYLARVVISSDELSEADQRLAIERGILEIVQEDVYGVYLRVTESTAASLVAPSDTTS